MLMAFVMLFIWQSTNDLRYQMPFQKTAEAVYEGSEAKRNVEAAKDKIRESYPIPMAIVPMGYALGIKRQISVNNQSITPIPGTLANYNLNYQTKTMGISVSWKF